RKSKVHYHVAVIINYLGHCISLGALLLAFTLFMRLRSIRCLRNIIHWNLISAFILRNATWFIVQLTMKPSVTESNQVWCRLVTAAYNYFHVTNFFWMFGEGCYLHTAVVLTYSTDKLRKWMFVCIGWGIPFPIIVAWAFGKLYYDNEKCWFGKKAGVYTDYIYQGPMILVLLVRTEPVCVKSNQSSFNNTSAFAILPAYLKPRQCLDLHLACSLQAKLKTGQRSNQTHIYSGPCFESKHPGFSSD
ncbi:Corticotropin-releasing factor receptor 1, partial [Characodon lateralis]|nr:Corticotropin-releasing factor receptor 1 [Characodon lateralis]